VLDSPELRIAENARAAARLAKLEAEINPKIKNGNVMRGQGMAVGAALSEIKENCLFKLATDESSPAEKAHARN